MDRIDEAVLGALRELLTPDLVDGIVTRLRALAAEDDHADPAADLARELAAAEAQVARYVEAIAHTGDVPAVAQRLRMAEERRQALARTQRVDRRDASGKIDWCVVEREARVRLQEWRRLLGRQTEEARPVLRVLLEDRKIRFTPFIEADRRGYAFDGDAGVGGLIAGVVECHGNWRPHRDSNPGFSLERAAS
jgi:hypothetical protein